MFKNFYALRIFILIFALTFTFGAKCQAEELDPIAAQHLYITKDSVIVPVEKLRSGEKITPEGTFNLTKKQRPLDVIERGDGTYTIMDGNKIFAALKELGAKNFPVIVHPFPYQKNVKNIKDLYALNYAVENEFKNLIKSLQEEYGGEIKTRPYIKKEKRVREKAKLEYNGDYSCITDLWAASLVFDNVDDLLAAAEGIKKRDDVVWINDRWNNPLPQGYRDFQLCLILSNGAIDELQLHYKPIFELDTGADHKIYEFVRSNMKKEKMQACIQRARNCQKILYAMAMDGRFSALDENTKKDLLKITTELSTQKSPKKAAVILDELEKFLDDISAEGYNIAA